jgi:hypothetical protein
MKRILLAFSASLFAFSALAQEIHWVPYGEGPKTFDFFLLKADGTFDVDESDSGSEVAIELDEGAPTTGAGVADFVDEGNSYSVVLTAAQLTAARIEVEVSGEILNGFLIETYGCPQAQDPRGSKYCGNLTSGSTLTGLNVGAAFTTTGQWNGMIFYDKVTGERGVICTSTNNGSTDTATVAGLNTVPGSTDAFAILTEGSPISCVVFPKTDGNGHVYVGYSGVNEEVITAQAVENENRFWNNGGVDDTTTMVQLTAGVANSSNAATQLLGTHAEPGSIPAANAPALDKIAWMFAMVRNKLTQTVSQQCMRNDADSANIACAPTTDNGTTFTRGEFN